MSVGHDAVAFGDPGRDNRYVSGGGTDGDQACDRRVVGGHYPGEQALWSALDGGRGYSKNIPAGLHLYARIDELSRPQPLVVVGEHRLEPDCGCRLVDHV